MNSSTKLETIDAEGVIKRCFATIVKRGGCASRGTHEQGWSFLQALGSFIFTPLGEGVVNIPAVIRALSVMEDPTAIAWKNRLYLEGLLESES
jgi:hypothetical protein